MQGHFLYDTIRIVIWYKEHCFMIQENCWKIQGELLNDTRRINVWYKENCWMIQGELLNDTRRIVEWYKENCCMIQGNCWKIQGVAASFKMLLEKTIEKQLFIFILFSEKSNWHESITGVLYSGATTSIFL